MGIVSLSPAVPQKTKEAEANIAAAKMSFFILLFPSVIGQSARLWRSSIPSPREGRLLLQANRLSESANHKTLRVRPGDAPMNARAAGRRIPVQFHGFGR